MLIRGTFILNEAKKKKEKHTFAKDFSTILTTNLAGSTIGSAFNRGFIGGVVGSTLGAVANQKRKKEKQSIRKAFLGKSIHNFLKKRGI